MTTRAHDGFGSRRSGSWRAAHVRARLETVDDLAQLVSLKLNAGLVLRSGAFDGQTLTYREHGSELTIPRERGLYEPSVIGFEGKHYLTMRADHSAFVSSSQDGLNYEPIKEWTFDDGQVLGSYNTQQHWMTIGGNLYLVYTRRGAGNDHVFRHRAPLFIGQVDPESLQVLRETEQILVPEDGATLGNSGVCRISDTESWVTVAEGRVSLGDRSTDANRVFLVKVTSPP